MSLKNEIRDLIIFLLGCFSINSYAIDTMDGPSFVPKISGVIGRISACTGGTGGNSTWIMISNRDDKKSLQIQRTTQEYFPKRKSWQTFEYIPLDKITIVDSLEKNNYELTLSSSLYNFQYKFTKNISENSWTANLRLEKELFLDCVEKELWCNEISPQLKSWADKRIDELKTIKR